VTEVVKTVTQSSSAVKAADNAGPTVPKGLTDKTLDDIEDLLDNKGISYTTVGGNVFFRGDWGVCSTTPAAGQPISGAIVLHIGHFTSGAS
jgi:hypothetical protein